MLGRLVVLQKKKKKKNTVKLLRIAFAENKEQGQHGTCGLDPESNSIFFLEIKGYHKLSNSRTVFYQNIITYHITT